MSRYVSGLTVSARIYGMIGVLELFAKHLKDGRVLSPLLKTLTLLINRLCIDGLVNDSSFSNHLLMYLKKEESTCTDVHRLSAIIDVNMGLLGAENDCQKVCGVIFQEVFRLLKSSHHVLLLDRRVGDHVIRLQTLDASLS